MIGPTTIQIPHVICGECEFHARQFRDGVTNHYCQHPKARTRYTGTVQGVYIGTVDRCPVEWCPVVLETEYLKKEGGRS